MGFLNTLFGDKTEKILGGYQLRIERINLFEKEIETLSDDVLQKKTDEFKARLKNGERETDILEEAFALVREAARRTLGQRHFDVQLLGGIILHEGHIAEMKTGEGKTLVATLPAYLNALSGRGVHVITVNDYLARRDAVWMGQIYSALGLSVGVLNHQASYLYDPSATQKEDTKRDVTGSYHIVHEFLKPCTRKETYAADITYGTNSEFGFDYLRDNLVYNEKQLVQRGFYYAIVDEIDSILIDEARTPLIISAPVAKSESLYPQFAIIARKLVQDTDYTVDEKLRAVQLTDSGISKAEAELGIENMYTEGGVKYVHHLETAVRAQALYERDREYVVRGGEVIIVDSFTGRLQPGRRWSEGLHQAIEAKEGVLVRDESRTFASISYQNYFKLYEKLSGMTGTALTSAEEFSKVYGLETLGVPTNRPMVRIDHNDLVFQTEQGKFKAIARRIKELHAAGRPVLVGTVSIEKNELLSAYLKREGVPHEILNAKNHEREGEIIAEAGKKHGVTIATNMAGRGVDIKLGGPQADKVAYEEIKTLGGLYVIGTERHEARRIDNQLRGRSGRQGDSGETEFYLSLEDTLMRVFASDKIKSMMGRFGIPEDEPIKNSFVTKAIESAQEKIEGFNFDARKHLFEFDTVLNKQRESIYGRRRRVLGGDLEVLSQELSRITEAAEDVALFKKSVIEKEEKFGKKEFLEVIRAVILQVIDMFWIDHLEAMDYMRGSVNLRAYGQRDPLIEYKKEGLRMFEALLTHINTEIARIILHISPVLKEENEKNIYSVRSGAEAITSHNNVLDAPKVGRNDPCPCGSGKKYKKCHGE